MRIVVIIMVLFINVIGYGYQDTVYVNTNATGNENGSDWQNAYTTLQAGYNAARPGYLILCRGEEILSTPVFLDKQSNITIEGINGKYVLDANNNAYNCISKANVNHIVFRSIIFTKATDDGVNLSNGGDYYVFDKCISKNNGADGWDMGNQSHYNLFINCNADSNNGIGLNSYGLGTKVIFSKISNNLKGGLNSSFLDYLNINNSIIANNGNYGIRCDGANIIMNNVIDNNSIGIMLFSSSTSKGNVFIGNRITNNLSGINANSRDAILKDNYFYSNQNAIVNSINIKTDSTNIFNVGNDDGYNNPENGDYTLKSSAVMRNIKITIGAY